MNNEYNESRGFLSGKGFYIALMLCVSVIALSAWMLVNGSPEDESEEQAAATPAVYPNEQTVSGALEPQITPVMDTMEPLKEEVPEIVTEPEPVQQTTAEVPQQMPISEPVKKSYVWPMVGEIGLPYSMDRLVYHTTMGDWRTHDGIDIAGNVGEFVRAAADGVVSDVYDDDLYGTSVTIDHGEGLVSCYANLQEVPSVKEGDRVYGGDIIGSVGSSALCESGEEPHLHFSMSLNGDSVDPAAYLPQL